MSADELREQINLATGARSGESTSAPLRCVEQERDELAKAFDEADNARLAREVDLARARRERDEALDQQHLARAELATATAELERLRARQRDTVAEAQWCVARDGGRVCSACEQEIRRGEAYSVNTVSCQLTHVHCPTGGAS